MIRGAEEKWAILTHHDAITGTNSPNVDNDYYKILNEAFDQLSQAYLLLNNMGERISQESLDILQYFIEELSPKNDKIQMFTRKFLASF